MSKLVDPHICPDCRAPLDAGGVCTGCGLRLVGPGAVELWQLMQQADHLIERMRATPATDKAAREPLPRAPLPQAPHVGASTPPARPLLPSASVPVVLLTLGGLCLLVAAVVFVAVAWGSLGLAAKTAIMLGVTALFAAGAVVLTRRGLRFGAETFWLIVAGMVAVDLSAAYGADLFGLGRLDDRDAVGMIGATLLGLAVGVGAWASTTVLRHVHGLVGVAAVGTLLLASAEAWTSEHNPLAVAVSVPVIAALALGIDRVSSGHLRLTAAVVGSAAVISWLVLVGHGVDRMATTETDRAWWTDLAGWPLLAAAALAAALAVAPVVGLRVPVWARMVAAGGSLVTLALFVVGPSTGATADLLAWAAASLLVAAVAAVAPTTWARPAAALTTGALVVWTSVTLVRPLAVILELPTTAPVEELGLGVHLPAVDGPAAWTAIVSALVVGAAAVSLLPHVPSAATRDAAGRAWIALGPGVLALGATTWLLETEPTLLIAGLAWAATLAVAGAMAVTVRHHAAPLATSLVFVLYLAIVGLRLAVASHLLAAALATGIALLLAAAYARAERELLWGRLLPVLSAGAVLTAGFAAIHWPYLADGRGDAAGVSLALVAAAALLLARPAGRDEPSRITIEVTALLAGLVATSFPVEDTVVAMVLTIVGTAVALVAVLNRDRVDAAWLGIVLLGAATVIRVFEDVRAPEAYTLPAAALLLGAGWWRLGADPRLDSGRALGSGLTLALLPSLLLALDEPVSVRGAIVGAAGLVVLAVGIARLWAAPVVAGAVTAGVLALRHLGPVADALPRWISLGSVGLALLLVGVTWEQRRGDLQSAHRYLTSLR